MSRIFKQIKVENNSLWTLLDTGATYSYILNKFVPDSGKRIQILPPKNIVLGGQHIIIEEVVVLEAELDGHRFLLSAKPVEYLGQDEHGKEIEAIIGAVNMEGALMKLDTLSGEIKFLEQLTEF